MIFRLLNHLSSHQKSEVIFKQYTIEIRAYNQQFKLLTMSEEGNSLNLSIQLEENQQKKKQQFDEFFELTKKIAESDRNNDILRQMKRNKLAQATKIRTAHGEVLEEKQSLKQRQEQIAETLKAEKIAKARRNQQIQQLNDRFDYLSKKERALEEQSNSLGKDNDKLEKQILKMQIQYEELLRKNKEKQEVVQKLRQKKQQQENDLKESQSKITELQSKCEKSKANAEILQQKLKKQYQINEKLQKSVKEKQEQLRKFKKQRQQIAKRQEDIKRTNNKLSQKAQTIEKQIDQKLTEFKRAQDIHQKLELQIDKFIESQRNYEQILSKRNDILMQLKKDCERVKRQSETQ